MPNTRPRERRLAAGLCSECGQTPHLEGVKRCGGCTNTHKIYRNKRYHDLKAKGLCVVCKAPAILGIARCAECKLAHAARLRKQLTGVDADTYKRLFTSQEGKCAICGALRAYGKLAADHCHVTKRGRGLLCQGCNMGLGGFRDNPNRLQAAIEYLQRYQEIRVAA